MDAWSNFLTAVEAGLKTAATGTLSGYEAEVITDGQAFLATAKADLQTWTTQLAEGEITAADLADNVAGNIDLAKLQALTDAGIAAEALQTLRSTITKIVVDAAGRPSSPERPGRRRRAAAVEGRGGYICPGRAPEPSRRARKARRSNSWTSCSFFSRAPCSGGISLVGSLFLQRLLVDVLDHQQLQPVEQLRRRRLLLQARHLAHVVEDRSASATSFCLIPDSARR